MLETYAISQDLVVWNNSQPVDRPFYDPNTKRWTVTVDHEGTDVVLHPAHIVVATGTLGAPYMPSLPGREAFKGTVMHSVEYRDPKDFVGQHVVIIGAGNSSIDICQDLATTGAASVTMIQRSSTCVVSRSNVGKELSRAWPPGVPVDVSDFKVGSVPLGYMKQAMMSHQDQIWAGEQELHAKLRKGGVKLNIGPEGQGQFLLVFERGGGTCVSNIYSCRLTRRIFQDIVSSI